MPTKQQPGHTFDGRDGAPIFNIGTRAQKAVIVVALCFAFATFSYSVAIYNAAEATAQAEMMKACVGAGRQWVKNWGPTHSCIATDRR